MSDKSRSIMHSSIRAARPGKIVQSDSSAAIWTAPTVHCSRLVTVYSSLRLSDTVLHSGGVITAQVNVQNTGDIAGDEVVQLYICDRVGSVVRPVQELKGFQRIHLEPKECRTVTFEITEDMLKFYNAALEYTVEPGMFDVMVGPSSVDVLTAGFQKI